MTRTAILALLFTGLLVATTDAAPPDTVDPAINTAVARGLAYLSHQQQSDGSFAAFQDASPRGRSTAVAALAFLSAGRIPDHGAYSLTVHNALSFLLRTTPGDGYFGLADESGMTGQSLILFALAEAHGAENDATQRAQVAPLLRAGLNATLAMQDRRNTPDAGGWGEQGEKPGTLAATAVTVLSLRALQDAGIDVPADALHRAVAFARSCQKGSSFADPGRPPNPSSTSAGVSILLLTKEMNAKDADLPKSATQPATSENPLGTYLSALDSIFSSDPDSPVRNRALRAAVCARQSPDGAWPGSRPEDGAVFPTSTALLSLTASYRLLPIYPMSK